MGFTELADILNTDLLILDELGYVPLARVDQDM